MSVRCMLCNEELGMVTGSHLRCRHGTTADEYRKRFPDAPTFVHSEETKRLIREAGMGNTYSLGHTHSEETKQLMREAHIGKVHSEETKKLQSDANVGNTYALGYTHSVRAKELIRKALMGIERSEETRKLLSETSMGNANALGCTRSEETRKLMSEANLGKVLSEETRKLLSERHRENWKDPDYARRMMGAQHQKPNGSELQLQSILDKHFPGEWEYVGDGKDSKDWFGGRNPDFIHANGRKQVIELFGIYWHDPILFPNRMSEEELVAHYKKYSIDCLVVWEYDIFDEDVVVRAVRGLESVE